MNCMFAMRDRYWQGRNVASRFPSVYAGAAVGGVVMLSGVPVGCLPLCRRVVGAAVVQKCVVFLTASVRPAGLR